MLIMKEIVNLEGLDRYTIRSTGAKNVECIGQSRYSFLNYPTDEAERFEFRWNFFGFAIGQEVRKGDPTIRYTYADTNMELPSQIPSPNCFLIQSMRLVCMDESGRVRLKYYGGHVRMFIGSCVYETQPMDTFSVASQENRIPIDPYICIAPNQNFLVQAEFSRGREPARAGVYLEGLYYRNEQ